MKENFELPITDGNLGYNFQVKLEQVGSNYSVEISIKPEDLPVLNASESIDMIVNAIDAAAIRTIARIKSVDPSRLRKIKGSTSGGLVRKGERFEFGTMTYMLEICE